MGAEGEGGKSVEVCAKTLEIVTETTQAIHENETQARHTTHTVLELVCFVFVHHYALH